MEAVNAGAGSREFSMSFRLLVGPDGGGLVVELRGQAVGASVADGRRVMELL